MATSVYGYPNRHSSQSQRNGAHNPQRNSNKADDRRFQKDKLYSRCYFGGSLHVNGSIWMSVDCLIVFTCVNSYVVHGKSSGCSEFGDCVKVRQGGICRCRPGFIGNGLTCAFLQDKVAPTKYRYGHAPHNNVATIITPTVPADRLLTAVGVNVKRRPTYPDWGNRRRQPLRNRPWGRQNRNNFIKKNDNKRWRPSKRRPLLNANEPGRQSPSVHLNVSPEFSEVGRGLMAKDTDNPKLVKNRPGFKKVPRNHMTDRTHPSKPRSEQQMKPKIFTHLNKPNRDKKLRKKLVKPLMKDKPQFMGNHGHPRTLYNSRVIPDTLPQNNLDSYPALIKNEHGRIHITCKRKNGRRICKLIRKIYKNDKTVPNANVFNPGLGKGQRIPINNNFRPHKKTKTNPVGSPNKDKDLIHIIEDIMLLQMRRYLNNTHNEGDPTSRTLTNPKRNNPRSNRPSKKDHKIPHLNQRRYNQPIQSDMKRVTEKETDKVTVSRWDILPLSSSLFTSPTTGKYTLLDSTATFTPTTFSFINPASKRTGDGRFSYSPLTSTSENRHVRTLSTTYTSLEQPRSGPSRRPLSNDNGGFPGRKGDTVKNNTQQNPGGNVKHRYPTADGTIDGLVIDPPSKWPLGRPGAKPGYGNQNIPINKKQFPKYLNKGQNKHRPSKNRHQPNTGPKINSINRKCRWIGCAKRKNATNKDPPFLHRKDVLYPSTTSSSDPSDQVLTLSTTALYTTEKTMALEKNNQTVDSKPQIINPNTPNKKHKPQPPSTANSEDQSERCEEMKKKNPLSGLHYKLLKKIKQSVEEIES